MQTNCKKKVKAYMQAHYKEKSQALHATVLQKMKPSVACKLFIWKRVRDCMQTLYIKKSYALYANLLYKKSHALHASFLYDKNQVLHASSLYRKELDLIYKLFI